DLPPAVVGELASRRPAGSPRPIPDSSLVLVLKAACFSCEKSRGGRGSPPTRVRNAVQAHPSPRPPPRSGRREETQPDDRAGNPVLPSPLAARPRAKNPAPSKVVPPNLVGGWGPPPIFAAGLGSKKTHPAANDSRSTIPRPSRAAVRG